MSLHSCCQTRGRTVDGGHRPPSGLIWRRGGEIAGWSLSTLTLALLPKCPACVAAYVAVATGIGISLPTASNLRTLLMVMCVVSLFFLALRRLRDYLG